MNIKRINFKYLFKERRKVKAKGHESSKRKRNKRILFISAPLLALLVFFSIIMLMSFAPVDVYTNTAEIHNTINGLQSRIIELDNIFVLKQPNSTSCGITTIAIASNYFNNTNYSVNDYVEKYTTGSSSGGDMKDWLQREMPERSILYKENVTAEEMIRDIHASLDNKNPVVIMFGAVNIYNEPYYDFHASLVYGINLDDETITIANAYGYIEEISLVDFLNRMSYTETSKYPFMQKISIRFFQSKNAYFLIS
jgi:hypothetical protein